MIGSTHGEIDVPMVLVGKQLVKPLGRQMGALDLIGLELPGLACVGSF